MSFAWKSLEIISHILETVEKNGAARALCNAIFWPWHGYWNDLPAGLIPAPTFLTQNELKSQPGWGRRPAGLHCTEELPAVESCWDGESFFTKAGTPGFTCSSVWPPPMHIWAALTRLSGFSETTIMTLGGECWGDIEEVKGKQWVDRYEILKSK